MHHHDHDFRDGNLAHLAPRSRPMIWVSREVHRVLFNYNIHIIHDRPSQNLRSRGYLNVILDSTASPFTQLSLLLHGYWLRGWKCLLIQFSVIQPHMTMMFWKFWDFEDFLWRTDKSRRVLRRRKPKVRQWNCEIRNYKELKFDLIEFSHFLSFFLQIIFLLLCASFIVIYSFISSLQYFSALHCLMILLLLCIVLSWSQFFLISHSFFALEREETKLGWEIKNRLVIASPNEKPRTTSFAIGDYFFSASWSWISSEVFSGIRSRIANEQSEFSTSIVNFNGFIPSILLFFNLIRHRFV